jgi:hypothetical protein
LLRLVDKSFCNHFNQIFHSSTSLLTAAHLFLFPLRLGLPENLHKRPQIKRLKQGQIHRAVPDLIHDAFSIMAGHEYNHGIRGLFLDMQRDGNAVQTRHIEVG